MPVGPHNSLVSASTKPELTLALFSGKGPASAALFLEFDLCLISGVLFCPLPPPLVAPGEGNSSARSSERLRYFSSRGGGAGVSRAFRASSPGGGEPESHKLEAR